MAGFPAATTLLLLFSTLTLTTTTASSSSPPPPSSPAVTCSDAVIAISPCLPFISDPPNYLSTRPSSQCCDLFTSSFTTGEAICLCYLIRGNRLLGFPVNTTRLLSLSSICIFEDNRSNSTTSLQSICSDAHKLPALVRNKGPIISIPHNFDSDDPSHPPLNTTTASSHGQSSSSVVPSAAPNESQWSSDADQFPPEMIFVVLFLCFCLPFVLGNEMIFFILSLCFYLPFMLGNDV